ncbi:hypothetical protein [Aurantimonas coralicida]|uniref:hypothetical protein n=1 Tax=Aurantimonas coralicida TaxID=182270 RepID=UPI001E56EA32|nr:hypothetical protein [Aurantimonas coralicida]MCD1645699.1 hypothetical protein [Aurantimonas coralicida]
MSKILPEKFGFEYEHSGKTCWFDVEAIGKNEAVAQIKSMVNARYIGRLRRQIEPNTANSDSNS